MTVKYVKIDNPEHFGGTVENGSHTATFVAARSNESAAPLVAAFDGVMTAVAHVVENYIGPKQTEKIADAVKTIYPAIKAEVKSAVAASRALDEQIAGLTTPEPFTGVDAAALHFRTLDHVEQARFLATGDLPEIASAIRAGKAAFALPELWDIALDKHGDAKLTKTIAGQHPKIPTLETPFAYGPDMASAAKAAAEHWKAIKAKRAAIGDRENTVKLLFFALAVVTGQSPSAVFAEYYGS